MGFIGAIICGIFIYKLYNRMNRLEREVASLRSGQPVTQVNASMTQPAVPTPPPVVPAGEQATSPTHASAPPPPTQVSPMAPSTAFTPGTVTPSSPEESGFIAWLKEDFLVKLGAFLLLIGLGWFVSYAFMNDWIGPMGRISLGLFVGIAFMMLGLIRVRTHVHQGGIFTVVGSTTVLLTIFAARELYNFFTPATALVVMFLAVLFVAFIAVKVRSNSLAIASVVLGGVAPLLTNTDPNVIGIFSYLLVLSVGSLWVVYTLRSHAMLYLNLVIVFLYGAPYLGMARDNADSALALMFAFIFSALFFVASLVNIMQWRDETARYAQAIFAFSVGLYLIVWVAAAVRPELQSLVYAGWMFVFAFGAFVTYLRIQDRAPFYFYSAVSVGLLAAATAAELSGPALTLAYIFEVTAILVAASRVIADQRVLTACASLYVVPVLLSFEHLVSSSWRDGVLHGDMFVILFLIVALFIGGSVFLRRRSIEERYDVSDMGTVLIVTAAIYTLLLVWLVTHAIFPDDVATMMSLTLYMIAGLATFAWGQSAGRSAIKTAGGCLIGFVAARLLLIDVWQMELVGRIITFIGLGLLLISTAFMNKFKKPTHHD